MKIYLRPPPDETPPDAFPLPVTADEMALAAARLAELRAKADGADEPIIVVRGPPG